MKYFSEQRSPFCVCIFGWHGVIKLLPRGLVYLQPAATMLNFNPWRVNKPAVSFGNNDLYEA
jgi:hypothetical protein